MIIYAKELGRPPVKPNTYLAGESYQNRYKTISTVKGAFLPVYSGDWWNFSWLAPITLLQCQYNPFLKFFRNTKKSSWFIIGMISAELDNLKSC